MEKKVEKVPKTVYAFYVKLYCKRKDGATSKYHNNMVEATKSWLSLSKNERLQILDKYKDFQNKYKKMFANYLKSAEPYMKGRNHRRGSTLNDDQEKENTEDGKIDNNSVQSAESKSKEDNINNFCPDDNRCLSDNMTTAVISKDETKIDNINTDEYISQQSMRNHVQETNYYKNTENLEDNLQTEDCVASRIIDEENTNESEVYCPLPEPALPTVKSGQELFELVKAMNNEHEATWISLDQVEKRVYQNAVLDLKKDYIRKYKAYLESLSLNDLFDYYNKVL